MSISLLKFCLTACKMSPNYPPPPPPHLAEEAVVIADWAKHDQGASSSQVSKILGCMSEEYLVCLPSPPCSTPWPLKPTPSNYRFLFRRQVACILKWRGKRRVEGSKNGFNAAVNAIVREVLWPEGADVRDEEVSVLRECLCLAPPTCGPLHPIIAASDPSKATCQTTIDSVACCCSKKEGNLTYPAQAPSKESASPCSCECAILGSTCHCFEPNATMPRVHCEG